MESEGLRSLQARFVPFYPRNTLQTRQSVSYNMRRVSTFMKRLRTVSAYTPPPEAPEPSTIRRRASASDLLSPVPTCLNNNSGIETASINSRSRNSQFQFKDVFSVKESDPPPAPPTVRDELPKDHLKLEGLLNYHIGQLERIKREVDDHNATVEQLSYTHADMQQHEYLTHAAECLYARIQGIKNARNLLAKFVAFHIQEVERIAEVKHALKQKKVSPSR